MSGIEEFHACLIRLLHQVGFHDVRLEKDQDVLSLEVDSNFDMHFIYAEPDSWILLAELRGLAARAAEQAFLQSMLRMNQLSDKNWQPVVGLNAENIPVCWLRLPLRGMNGAKTLAAFSRVITCVESMGGSGLSAIGQTQHPAGNERGRNIFKQFIKQKNLS